MSEDERTIYKVVILKGSDNYEDWKLSVSSVLLSKDLIDYIDVKTAIVDDKNVQVKRKAGKAFASHYLVAPYRLP
jgi:hypothetical protein